MGLDRFAEYLARLDKALRKVMDRITREMAGSLHAGISLPQFHLMRFVAEKGAPTVSEVAEIGGVTLSAITSLADRLYKAGLLTRERDQNDRRLVRLRLTEDGKAKLAQMERRQVELLRPYLGSLPQEDLDRLLEIFNRLAAIAEETGPVAESPSPVD